MTLGLVETCLELARLIDHFEGEDLSLEEAAHLDECESCQQQLRELQEGEDLLASLQLQQEPELSDDGLVFGNWHHCREIGRGASSVVYVGENNEGRQAAIKVCRHQSFFKHFQREVHLLELCREKGVAGVPILLDQGMTQCPAWIAMPYYAGGSLTDKLSSEQALMPFFLRQLLSQVAGTLKQVHTKLGLVHGEYQGHPTVGHNGSFMGFRTSLLRFPTADLAVMVLSNLGDVNAGLLAKQVAAVCLEEGAE